MMRRRCSPYTRPLPTSATRAALAPRPSSKVSSQPTLATRLRSASCCSRTRATAKAAFSAVGASTPGGQGIPGATSVPSGHSARPR